jgi:integrase
LGDVATTTKKEAKAKADEIVSRMNTAVGVTVPRTVRELVLHYRKNELPLKATSTQAVYGSFIDTWIVPKWGASLFRSMETMQFENWLKTIPRPNGTKSKIKNIMSAIYTHAQRYKFCKENPIMLVRQSAKREREPDVLDADEINAVLAELADPCRTVVHVAACTGLRISELLALKWEDVDLRQQEIRPVRAIVDNIVGELKTEASGKPVPIDVALAEALMDWRGRCPYNQDGDYVFGSLEMKGTQPYSPDTMRAKTLKPAAARAGIEKVIGWHSFRRTYATLLHADGAAVKTTQDLLRHANSKTTMDVYAQSIPAERRAAQSKVGSKIGNGERNICSLKVVESA